MIKDTYTVDERDKRQLKQTEEVVKGNSDVGIRNREEEKKKGKEKNKQTRGNKRGEREEVERNMN